MVAFAVELSSFLSDEELILLHHLVCLWRDTHFEWDYYRTSTKKPFEGSEEYKHIMRGNFFLLSRKVLRESKLNWKARKKESILEDLIRRDLVYTKPMGLPAKRYAVVNMKEIERLIKKVRGGDYVEF